MTFQPIQKGEWKSKRRPPVTNRVAYYTAAKDGSAVTFSVSGDLVKTLGSPKRVQVLLGTGEHKGRILIKAARDGETGSSYALTGQPSSLIKKFTLSNNRLGLSGKARYKTTTTDHRVTEEGLMVWLPS